MRKRYAKSIGLIFQSLKIRRLHRGCGPEQCELKTTKISLATSQIEMQITNGDFSNRDSDFIAGRF